MYWVEGLRRKIKTKVGVKYKNIFEQAAELLHIICEVLSDEEDETVTASRELRAKRRFLPRHIDVIKTPQLNNSFMRATRLSCWTSSREKVGRQNDRHFIWLYSTHRNLKKLHLLRTPKKEKKNYDWNVPPSLIFFCCLSICKLNSLLSCSTFNNMNMPNSAPHAGEPSSS